MKKINVVLDMNILYIIDLRTSKLTFICQTNCICILYLQFVLQFFKFMNYSL